MECELGMVDVIVLVRWGNVVYYSVMKEAVMDSIEIILEKNEKMGDYDFEEDWGKGALCFGRCASGHKAGGMGLGQVTSWYS